ncbi:MAG: hypothetical protein HC915_21050, partial [Anaerolineae bacterium]|nr:hypothetical protein [Anaerolineae bacterium]
MTFEDVETASAAADTLRERAKRVQLDRSTVRLYLPEAASAVPAFVTALEQA